MNGPGHRVVAVAAWLGAAPHLGVTTPWQVAAGAVIAGACGHGRLSPDMDHPTVAPLLARLVPGGHRGILHWPPVPLVMLWAAGHTGVYAWQALAVAVAWVSHLAADAVFGKIPLWPRVRRGWHRAGLGLATGGQVERWVAVPAATVAAAWWGGLVAVHAAAASRWGT